MNRKQNERLSRVELVCGQNKVYNKTITIRDNWLRQSRFPARNLYHHWENSQKLFGNQIIETSMQLDLYDKLYNYTIRKAHTVK